MKTVHFNTGKDLRNLNSKTFEGVKPISKLLNSNNPKYWTFISWENYSDILDNLKDKELTNLLELLEKSRENEDFSEFEKKTGLSLGKKIYVDQNGNYLIDYDAQTGVIEWDINDVDEIKYLKDCDYQELNLIYKSSEPGKIDLLKEYFDEYTDIEVNWDRFNGDFERLIDEYFYRFENINIEEFYTFYHIEISYGKDGKEYYNSYLINDDYTTKLYDNRQSFETKKEAETALESVLIPYAEKKGWQVRFSVEEDY